MIVTIYPDNDPGMYCQAQRDHNGVTFVVMYKNSSQLARTPDEGRKVFGRARNTEGVKALWEWCKTMYQKSGSGKTPSKTLTASTQQSETSASDSGISVSGGSTGTNSVPGA